MNIVVPIKLVPDLVEELSVDQSGTSLDTAWMRLIINELDDHAIEQAILLKEAGGGQVVVIAPDAEGVDDVLFTAAAKGADRLIKLDAQLGMGVDNHALARALAGVIKDIKPDLILTGVQAHNDLDGSLGPLLASFLDMPYVGYISGVTSDGGRVAVRKEYPGGLIAEMEVQPPAVLGIQAAEKPPRYVAVSKVRQAMQAATIESAAVGEPDRRGAPNVLRLFQPELAERATMIEGDPEQIAAKLVDVLREAGLV
jgi:electron transfer flavoprotein beta subunit